VADTGPGAGEYDAPEPIAARAVYDQPPRDREDLRWAGLDM